MKNSNNLGQFSVSDGAMSFGFKEVTGNFQQVKKPTLGKTKVPVFDSEPEAKKLVKKIVSEMKKKTPTA